MHKVLTNYIPDPTPLIKREEKAPSLNTKQLHYQQTLSLLPIMPYLKRGGLEGEVKRAGVGGKICTSV